MGALREENTTCNSQSHLHKSSLCVLGCTIYTPRTDKQREERDGGGEGGGDERMRGRCFTLDGSYLSPGPSHRSSAV